MPELNKLLIIVESKQLPPKESRYVNSFAKAFTVWGWSMQNPAELFISLSKLNNDYGEL